MHYYLLQASWSTDNTLIAISTGVSFIAAGLTMYVTLRINTFKIEVIAMMDRFKIAIDKKFDEADVKMEVRVKEIEKQMVTRDNMDLIQKNFDLQAENIQLKSK